MGVDIRPRVLGFASLEQDVRNKVIDLANELEHLVVGQVLQGKFALGSVARVRLSKNGVTVTGDDLTTLERGPDVVLDGLIRGILANLALHLPEPDEDFLIGEAMERTGETVEGGAVGEERIREGRTNKFTSVCGDVSAFVIAVDGDVEAEEFDEGLVVAKAEESGKVV